MTAWTLVGGLMLISAVTLTILSVVRLDGRFRGEQQGLPANPDEGHGSESDLHPTGT
jgi:hypothetical protein